MKKSVKNNIRTRVFLFQSFTVVLLSLRTPPKIEISTDNVYRSTIWKRTKLVLFRQCYEDLFTSHDTRDFRLGVFVEF